MSLYRPGFMRWVAALATFLCVCVVSAQAAEADFYRLFDDGKRLLDQGELDEAVEAFSKALTLLPSNDRNRPVVVLARANAYLRKKDVKKALNDLNVAFQSNGLEPELRASALNLRGNLYSMSGKQDAALKDFTTAIKILHDNYSLRAACFANRGKVQIDLQSYGAALSDFDKALELDPDSSFSYAAKGLAYLKLDRIEQARRAAERALAMTPPAETEKLAKRVLDSLTFSRTGPDSVEVPIGDDGHVFVQVRFGKQGKPRRFLLDTGATHSLISQDLLESAKAETEVVHIGSGRVMTADGSVHAVHRYRVSGVFLYNFPLDPIEVHVLPGRKVLAANLLGANSLKSLKVSIDTGEKKAELRRVEKDSPRGR